MALQPGIKKKSVGGSKAKIAGRALYYDALAGQNIGRRKSEVFARQLVTVMLKG